MAEQRCALYLIYVHFVCYYNQKNREKITLIPFKLCYSVLSNKRTNSLFMNSWKYLITKLKVQTILFKVKIQLTQFSLTW